MAAPAALDLILVILPANLVPRERPGQALPGPMRTVMIALSILVYVEALSTGAIRSTSIRHKPLRPARPCATCPRVAVNYPQMNSPLRIAVRSTEHQFKEGLVATPAVAFFGLGRPRVIIVLSLLALVSAVLVVARRKSGGVAPTEVYDDERAPPAAPTPSAEWPSGLGAAF